MQGHDWMGVQGSDGSFGVLLPEVWRHGQEAQCRSSSKGAPSSATEALQVLLDASVSAAQMQRLEQTVKLVSIRLLMELVIPVFKNHRRPIGNLVPGTLNAK